MTKGELPHALSESTLSVNITLLLAMKKLSKLISQSVYCVLSAFMVRQIQPKKADLDISMLDCELKSNVLFLYKSLQRRNKQRWKSSEMDKHLFSYSATSITISGETIDVKSVQKWGMDVYLCYIYHDAHLSSLFYNHDWYLHFDLHFLILLDVPSSTWIFSADIY